jgi:ABC-type amino acid transport substrate-binding protein
MLKRGWLLGGLLVAGAALCASVQGREITCYSTHFPPYVVEDGSGISGIDVDMVAEVARRAGVAVKFRLLPWVRLESELRRGAQSRVECGFAYTNNEARKAYMDFMQVPLKMTRYVMFFKKGRFGGSLAELKGKVVGLRRGFIVPGAFEEMRKRQELVVEEIDSDVNNFRKLAMGRIDAVITNDDVGRAVLDAMPQHDIEVATQAIVATPTFLVFNKGKELAALATAFDKVLQEMQDDGSTAQIRQKYLK